MLLGYISSYASTEELALCRNFSSSPKRISSHPPRAELPTKEQAEPMQPAAEEHPARSGSDTGHRSWWMQTGEESKEQILGRFVLLCNNECVMIQHNLAFTDTDATNDLTLIQ